MAVLRTTCHVETDMPTAGPTFGSADQRQVHRISDEIRFHQQTLLLAAICEVVGLAVKAVLEIVRRAEDEIDVFERIDRGWTVRDRDKTRGVLAGRVVVRVPAVQRDGEECTGLPFERDFCACFVTNGSRSST